MSPRTIGPANCAWPYPLKDGSGVVIRPIRPEDEPAMVRFHEGLSTHSVYFRYFHFLGLPQRVAHERLSRICLIDYDRDMALVGERKDPATGSNDIIAVGRLAKLDAANESEIAVLVSDAFQGLGLGTELVRRLVQVARMEGRGRIVADFLTENTAMQKVFRRLGFELHYSIEDCVMQASLRLGGSSHA